MQSFAINRLLMRETAPSITVIEPKQAGSLSTSDRSGTTASSYTSSPRGHKGAVQTNGSRRTLGGHPACLYHARVHPLLRKTCKDAFGRTPYPIFVYAGLLPWTYFANAVSASGNSLVGSSNLITKVYFPRIVVPASAALAGLLDFFIALFVLAALMIYYQFLPGPAILLFPFLVALTFLCAVGVGLWLSALNVQYRDIRYAIPFLIQVWMFVSPVIYPVSLVQGKYQWLLALNPMGGVIHAYRACLLGISPLTGAFSAFQR